MKVGFSGHYYTECTCVNPLPIMVVAQVRELVR